VVAACAIFVIVSVNCILLNTISMSTTTERTPTMGKRKNDACHLSKDGTWHSFPHVPHLLQYLNSGTYFARIKIKGKIIRESVEAKVWSAAQLKLVDFLKQKQSGINEDQDVRISFGGAAELFTKRVRHDPKMKLRSKGYRFLCVEKLKSSWPDLWNLLLHEITPHPAPAPASRS